MNGAPEPHERHDRHLVAALAADDLEPVVRTEAETLVASCRDCAELLADLRIIAAATAALPMVPRTRDFRITAADAARLRPTGWRGLLDAIAGARASFSRPLAAGLTTLGLVGLLVTTIPGALGGLSFGSAGAAPAFGPEVGRNGGGSPVAAQAPGSNAADGAASAAPVPNVSAAASAPTQGKVDLLSPSSGQLSVQAVGSAAPGFVGAYGVPPGGSKGGGRSVTGAAEASAPVTDQTTADGRLAPTATTTGPPPLFLASLVCLVVGLALFVARWGARRLARR